MFAVGAVHGFRGLGRDAVAFAMEAHLVDALDAQRREGAKADMQSQAGNLHAALGDTIEHLLREVEAGGWRCDRSAFFRKDSLVPVTIRGFIVAVDVRRQGDMPDAVKGTEEIFYRSELDE